MKPIKLVVAGLLLVGCARKQLTPADFLRASPAPAVLTDVPPKVRTFIEQKEQLAVALAQKLGVEPDRPTLEYFRLARKGHYRAASRIYQDLRERGGKVESPKHDPKLRLPLWDPLLEVQLTLDAYAAGAGKFATALGESIARSIPPGSIYFGGTDPGRGLPAAFAPVSNGVPMFHVLTQNQLVDGQHRDYIRAAFGDLIQCLSNDDVQQGFQDYLDDAGRRHLHDQTHPDEPRQLRPGEAVTLVGDTPQVSGQVAVMMINGLLARMLFDKNPDREFYVEESFPLDWMYPHLTPHGLILKLNRQPVGELALELVATNRADWNELQGQFIGRWLTPETSVGEACDFVECIFLRKDQTGFHGDSHFVGNRYATAAYSKLRVAQAGLFVWRISHAKSPSEQQRMIREAEFALRQAFAFCPSNPEAVYRYANLLLQTGRVEDALLVARTAMKIDPKNGAFGHLERELERTKQATGK